MKNETWLNSIIEAFRNLGGEAKYEELYIEIEKIRKSRGFELAASWKAIVRWTIEVHSSDSEAFKFEDIFKKLGFGYWGLRNYQNNTNVSNNKKGNTSNLDTELFIDGITREKLISLSIRNQKLIIARKILDNFTCQACGFHYNDKIVECHHLIPLSDTQTTYNSVNDLITLCPNCHALVHSIYHLDKNYQKREKLLAKLKTMIKDINR